MLPRCADVIADMSNHASCEQADEARDKEVKAIEASRFATEIELAKQEAEEEKRRRHEAYLRYRHA